MCYIGHGCFGIITKSIWCNYFGVFGIGHDMAYTLMPVVGTIDILLGLMMLVYPARIIPGWLVIWGLVTALLRPLSGEPVAEFFERAGNYGSPLAFLILAGNADSWKSWFMPVDQRPPGAQQMLHLQICLRLVAFLLLLGHGSLNLAGKASLLDQYASIGFREPDKITAIIGFAEITGGLLVLLRPARSLVLLLLIWKITSEVFYPSYSLFEWIERGGSYGILLALWIVMCAAGTTKSQLHFYFNKNIAST
jgi:hypothetical protein